MEENLQVSCLISFELYPQIIKNVEYSGKVDFLEQVSVKKIISESEKKLGSDGRLLIRKSGTEPLIRIMVEHSDSKLIEEIVQEISSEMKI